MFSSVAKTCKLVQFGSIGRHHRTTSGPHIQQHSVAKPFCRAFGHRYYYIYALDHSLLHEHMQLQWDILASSYIGEMHEKIASDVLQRYRTPTQVPSKMCTTTSSFFIDMVKACVPRRCAPSSAPAPRAHRREGGASRYAHLTAHALYLDWHMSLHVPSTLDWIGRRDLLS